MVLTGEMIFSTLKASSEINWEDFVVDAEQWTYHENKFEKYSRYTWRTFWDDKEN